MVVGTEALRAVTAVSAATDEAEMAGLEASKAAALEPWPWHGSDVIHYVVGRAAADAQQRRAVRRQRTGEW